MRALRSARCASSASTLAVDNPYSGETYCEVGMKTAEEAVALVEAASASQIKSPPKERRPASDAGRS